MTLYIDLPEINLMNKHKYYRVNIKILFLSFIIIGNVGLLVNVFGNYVKIPERTILFIIDGMPSGLNQRIYMPNLDILRHEGVLFREVYLPLAAHPDSCLIYPWTCSIPNPVLMSGTVFIGQEGIKRNLIQHSCYSFYI